jgi:type 1 fimbria pilin
MNPLFLTLAVSTLAASTGNITFRGAVVAPTCTYHHGEVNGELRARGCYQGLKPLVTAPGAEPDQATVDLVGDVPTWRFTYL